jgi:hypothetical protein
VPRQALFLQLAAAGIIRDLRYPGRQFGLKSESLQMVENFQINILHDILSVFFIRNQPPNDLGHQPFGHGNDLAKSRGVATQYRVDKLPVSRNIPRLFAHCLD